MIIAHTPLALNQLREEIKKKNARKTDEAEREREREKTKTDSIPALYKCYPLSVITLGPCIDYNLTAFCCQHFSQQVTNMCRR